MGLFIQRKEMVKCTCFIAIMLILMTSYTEAFYIKQMVSFAFLGSFHTLLFRVHIFLWGNHQMSPVLWRNPILNILFCSRSLLTNKWFTTRNLRGKPRIPWYYPQKTSSKFPREIQPALEDVLAEKCFTPLNVITSVKKYVDQSIA